MNEAPARSLPATQTQERQGIIQWAAQTFGVEGGKVMGILRSTCFKVPANQEPATDAEVAALLVVSRQFGLNPFLKQIHAFRAKDGGIVPIVGVDGWAAIVADHPKVDGFDFVESETTVDCKGKKVPEWIECRFYRKDRQHPTIVRERFAECYRDTMPWNTTPSRFLRHRAFMQAARYALAYTGLYDEEEGQVIAAGGTATIVTTPEPTSATPPVKPESRTAGLAAELSGRAKDAEDATIVQDTDKLAIDINEMNIETSSGVLANIMKLPDGDQRKKLLQNWSDRSKKLAEEKGAPPAPEEKEQPSKGKRSRAPSKSGTTAEAPSGAPASPDESEPNQPDLVGGEGEQKDAKPKGKTKADDEIMTSIQEQMGKADTLKALDEVASQANNLYEFNTDQIASLNDFYGKAYKALNKTPF